MEGKEKIVYSFTTLEIPETLEQIKPRLSSQV